MVNGSLVLTGPLSIVLADPVPALADEGSVVFRFPIEIVLIPVVIAVSLVAAGFAAPRIGIPPRFRWRLFLAGGIAGLFAPMIAADRVTVTPQGITQVTGFWFSPTTMGFRYGDVEAVRIVRKPIGLKRRMTTIWEVHYRDGRVEDINPGDLWENNTREILPLLRSHGVEVQEGAAPSN